MTTALVIEAVTRGYLASNQLTQVVNKLPAQVEATVLTTMSSERRQFSWLWDRATSQALLVNRLTGTIYDPETGSSVNSSLQLEEATIEVPRLTIGDKLPAGIFSTSEERK